MELSSKVNLCTARERPWLPLRRELDCCIKDLSNKTEGEITRGCCLHQRVGAHKMIQVSLLFCTRLYPLLSHILGVSLLPSRRFNPLYAVPPPSSEGGEAALCAAVRAQLPLCAPSVKTCRRMPHHNYSLLNIQYSLKQKKRLFGRFLQLDFIAVFLKVFAGQFSCKKCRRRALGKLTERAGNSPL